MTIAENISSTFSSLPSLVAAALPATPARPAASHPFFSSSTPSGPFPCWRVVLWSCDYFLVALVIAFYVPRRSPLAGPFAEFRLLGGWSLWREQEKEGKKDENKGEGEGKAKDNNEDENKTKNEENEENDM
ncbi:hypothetical protein NKR23_g1480 [Pleurostoma richardsiae]|uniref:Transmembrane protein n=1 Tax=Pleurostoma richardsiae TaxID=41990 RepID=A0AA38VZF6_9PEZI|nr:hypothetical protein NKR23_g1480 [Pleurostoma richardsiae]